MSVSTVHLRKVEAENQRRFAKTVEDESALCLASEYCPMPSLHCCPPGRELCRRTASSSKMLWQCRTSSSQTVARLKVSLLPKVIFKFVAVVAL